MWGPPVSTPAPEAPAPTKELAQLQEQLKKEKRETNLALILMPFLALGCGLAGWMLSSEVRDRLEKGRPAPDVTVTYAPGPKPPPEETRARFVREHKDLASAMSDDEIAFVARLAPLYYGDFDAAVWQLRTCQFAVYFAGHVPDVPPPKLVRLGEGGYYSLNPSQVPPPNPALLGALPRDEFLPPLPATPPSPGPNPVTPPPTVNPAPGAPPPTSVEPPSSAPSPVGPPALSRAPDDLRSTVEIAEDALDKAHRLLKDEDAVPPTAPQPKTLRR